MNYKRFLAGFLSMAMIFSQMISFDTNVYADSPSTAKKELSNLDKLIIGVGSGALLTVGITLILRQVYKNHENPLKKMMRKLVDSKNQGTDDATLYDKCRQKGLYPESVFNCVGGYVPGVLPQKRYVAVCYYGKNAFKNCLEDETESKKNGAATCALSTHTIWYDDQNKKYIFGAPGDKLPEGYYLRRFVEFGDRIYAATPWLASPSDTLIIDKLNVDLSGNVIAQMLGSVSVDGKENVTVDWWFFPGTNSSFRLKSVPYDKVVSKISTWPH